MLNQMQAPIQFRVVRVNKGTNEREPIPLPQTEWSKEDAEKIEGIVLNDISGGGNYEAQCTDASGKNFSWKFAFPDTLYPSRTPPMSQAAAAPMPIMVPNNGLTGAPVGAVWQAPHGQGYQMPPTPPPAYTPTPYATPRYGVAPPQFGYQQGQMGYTQPYAAPQMPPFYPQYAPQSQLAANPADAMRRELEQTRRDAAATEHRREREAADAKHQSDMAAMREEMRRLAEASSVQKPRGDDDPVLVALKAQNDLLKGKMDEQARSLDTEKAERARAEQDARHRDESARRDEQHRREMDELKRLIADSSANKTDPMMLMMMEHMRGAAEAQRDQNRVTAEAAAENARAAQQAPQQLMGLVESIRRSSGADTLMTNVAGAYDGAMGMMTRNMELVNQMIMGQQGSPVVGLIGESIEGVKELLTNVMSERQKTEQAAHKVKETEAQARMMHEQVVYAQATAAQAAAVAAQEGTPEAQQEAQEAQAEAQAKATQHADAVTEAVEAVTEAEAAEESEQEHEVKLFGVALKEVVALREHVAAQDLTIKTANDVAKGVIKSATHIKKAGVKIPAFVLYDEQMYADLIDHLLPGVPTDFAGMCVGEVTRLARLVKSHDDGIDALDTKAADPITPTVIEIVPEPEPEPALSG